MSRQRRIPAGRATPYANWSLPPVPAGAVVRAESARMRQRRVAEVDTDAVPFGSAGLEQELAANVRSGRFSPGVGAREVESIVAAAAEEGHRDGFAAGHAEGLVQGERAGRAEGLAAGRRYLEEAAGRFAGLLEALQAPLHGQEDALRDALLAAVLQIARVVLRVETQLQPGHIAQVLDEALAALPIGARAVRVFVSAADRELLEDFGGGEAVPLLLVDPALAAGDCRVEAEDSLVDFTQSARFAAIAEQFLGHAGAGPESR